VAAEHVLFAHCRNEEDLWHFLGYHLFDLSFLTASSTFFLRSEAVVMTYATSS
jgi:hypothetical protein